MNFSEIQKANAILNSIIESPSEVVIFALDTEYRYLAFNNKHKKEMKLIWGEDIEVGKCMLDFIKVEKDKKKAKENFDRALKGESFTLIEEYGEEEKKRAYYEDHYSPIVLESGKIIGLTVYLTEITERVKREKELKELNENLEKLVEERANKLRQTEKKLLDILDFIPEAIAIQKEGKVIYVNEGAVRIFGYGSKEEMINKGVYNFIHPDYKKKIEERQNKLYSQEIHLPFAEARFIRKDGTDFYGESSSISVKSEEGYYIYSFVRDLSERIKSQLELKKTHEIYLRAIENIDGVPYKFRYADKKYEFMGKGVKKLLRVSSDELDFNKLKSLINKIVILDEKYKSLTSGEYAQKLRSGELDKFRADYEIVFPDGEVKWINDSSVGIVDERTGKVVGSLGILQDITQRKLIEEKLSETISTSKQVIEDSSDGICIINYNGSFIEWNRSLERITGITKDVAIKKKVWNITAETFFSFKGKKTKEEITEAHKKIFFSLIKYGKNRKFEWTIKKGKNSKVTISIHTFVVKTENKKLLGAIVRDISRQKEIEENLIKAKEAAEKSNRLKSEFLAQISHEIRTPLNIILSFTDLIKYEVSKYLTEDIKYGFEAIGNASKRIIRTIDLILNMSEIQTGVYEPIYSEVNICSLLKDVLKEFKIRAGQKGIELIGENLEKNSVVFADEYSVNQIFVNLVENAIKYTQKGYVKIILKAGKRIKVIVEDTGIGIDKKFLPHIFDPFSQEYQGYTRKFEGNGLGLALVKEYCRINGADVSIESEKGKGTRVTVIFSKKPKTK